MLIGFFVNDLEREYENYTTTVLAHTAASRGHSVCYITPADFVLNADDSLSVHGRFLPKRKYKDRAEFFAALKDAKAVKIERVDGGWNMRVDYEVRKPLMANLDVVGKFSADEKLTNRGPD